MLTRNQRRTLSRRRMKLRAKALREQREAEGAIPPPLTDPPRKTGERGEGGLRKIEELAMVQRAVTGCYPIEDIVRSDLVDEAAEMMRHAGDPAVKLRACNVILAADSHNLKVQEALIAAEAVNRMSPADDDTRREGYAAAIQSDDTRKLLTQLGERLANPGEPSPTDTIVVTPKDDTKSANGKANGYSNGSNGHTNGNGKH